ncbi:type II 3-dehydroquinate dehydratase [Paraburkholderia heleia]|uniref:type II 3-dehydroquinate dehydratase n=1 Tax=Paraburkholderia heleia TaxID=634127 RepID=UPI0012EECAE3|nr:type II 3-dehydroquinate dehydratase [Paraburkholderia heleia]
MTDALELHCVFRQTNSESGLIDWIQNAFLQDAALIINPASFSFDRIAVLDVVNLIHRPVMELHIATSTNARISACVTSVPACNIRQHQW